MEAFWLGFMGYIGYAIASVALPLGIILGLFLLVILYGLILVLYQEIKNWIKDKK